MEIKHLSDIKTAFIMNTDGHLYSENEIAGNMMEEYDRKDQQISVEVKIYFFAMAFGILKCVQLINTISIYQFNDGITP